MMESAEYNAMNSKRTPSEDQQQEGRRNRAMGGSGGGKIDFRFLIPSRDAGGGLLSTE